MASITLKDIPPELLDRLRAAAKQDRRSLTQQALYLIEGGLSRQTGSSKPSAAAREQVRRWRALAGRWRSSESLEEELAGLRAARTAGRTVNL